MNAYRKRIGRPYIMAYTQRKQLAKRIAIGKAHRKANDDYIVNGYSMTEWDSYADTLSQGR